ncbi:MAG: 16S rRNA (cytidine(1402)-2'-O)-methyltransferase [Myxococcales bacterium]|nr:16S rRNA (cytidine(1402)-2'-O)-methyltransferase [Polyangiaceae bacterium]MDW8248423.1 16S rRNA (cytidine(1402)-2'-O)-methyltransferase [Myxococcales bacterium]
MSPPRPGALYLVATPIGNLDDLSRRAEACLRSVDRVLAEDTRRARALLSHLAIGKKPVERFDAHAGTRAIRQALEALARGETLALVTDAGTPSVSDPGSALARAAAEAGFQVIPIPGPSAVLAAVAGAALGDGAFRFFGFLPREGTERAEALARVVQTPEVVVLFESPHRLGATLVELAALQPGRPAVVARELTKLHEEFVRGSLEQLATLERSWLGEIVLVLGPHQQPAREISDEELDRWIDEVLGRGASPRDAAQQVAARSGRPRREVYARVLTRCPRG